MGAMKVINSVFHIIGILVLRELALLGILTNLQLSPGIFISMVRGKRCGGLSILMVCISTFVVVVVVLNL